MKLFTTSLICLLLTSNSNADSLENLLVASTTADLITTEIALSKPGNYELNPFMSNRYSRIGVKIASTGTIIAARRQLIKNNHKKAANIFTIFAIGLYAGVSINNYARIR